MRTCLALVLVAACSSKPAPPPAPVAAPPPPPPAPAVASCSDAGVILRGDLVVDEGEAGPAKEKAIAKACEDDAWPRAVIDCIASTPHPEVCLDRLDARRRLSYDQRMQAWSDDYGAGDGAFGVAGAMPPPPIHCEDVIGDGDNYRPPATLRPWARKQRRDLLVEECEHGWSEPLKSCLEIAEDAAKVDSCLALELSVTEIDELASELTEIDRLAQRIDAAKKKPATITCKKVVEAHYGDAAWKQKLDGFGPDERKRMIKASRELMTKACTADKWDESQRACLVVGGADMCFAGSGKRRWGYPATGTVTSLGIAECDAYSAEVTKLTSCSNMDAKARNSIVRSQHQMLAEIARVPAAERARMGSSCKAAMETIETILTAAGC